jgi:hypothetical protein
MWNFSEEKLNILIDNFWMIWNRPLTWHLNKNSLTSIFTPADVAKLSRNCQNMKWLDHLNSGAVFSKCFNKKPVIIRVSSLVNNLKSGPVFKWKVQSTHLWKIASNCSLSEDASSSYWNIAKWRFLLKHLLHDHCATMRRQENTRPQHPKSVDVQKCPGYWQLRFGTVQVLSWLINII